MVTEAGGTMTGFEGAPFALESKEILATNALLLPELQQFFGDMFAGRNIEPVPSAAEFAARRAKFVPS
jgi:myo-inositol-1(or 4)-monophosphatase